MGDPTAPGQFRSRTTVHNVRKLLAFVLDQKTIGFCDNFLMKSFKKSLAYSRQVPWEDKKELRYLLYSFRFSFPQNLWFEDHTFLFPCSIGRVGSGKIVTPIRG